MMARGERDRKREKVMVKGSKFDKREKVTTHGEKKKKPLEQGRERAMAEGSEQWQKGESHG